MEPAISNMTMDDYDEAVAFWRSQDGIALNESDEREAINRFLLRNPGMSLIARNASGTVVAAVLCGHDGRRGYLHHLAVDPAHRRKGLGRALVERCLAKLAIAGIPKCNVFLFTDNVEGRRFWEKLGYKSVTWIPMQRVIALGGKRGHSRCPAEGEKGTFKISGVVRNRCPNKEKSWMSPLWLPPHRSVGGF